MIKIKLICVGRLKEKFFADACAEYVKRLTPYARLEIAEVQEEPFSARSLASEAEKIKRLTPAGSFITALCVEGEKFSSEALAAKFSALMNEGESLWTFIIGGSNGLSEDLKRRVNLRLSMSDMTFPHHLARVMTLEQIYRAFKIIEGGSYHK